MSEPLAPADAPELAAPVDPLARLAARLGAAEGAQEGPADVAAEVSTLGPADLARLVNLVVEAAEVTPDAEAARRLEALRRATLLANARPALLRVLGAQAALAAARGDLDGHTRALARRVGLLDLLGEAERAWRARLDLADAQLQAEALEAAARTLQEALVKARALAPGGRHRLAAGCAARTLVRMARVASLQAQPDVAQAWAEGARQLGRDAGPEVLAEVEAALDRR